MGNYKGEVAIICLTAVALSAILQGIDSVLLTTVAAIIGGIAGYEIKAKVR